MHNMQVAVINAVSHFLSLWKTCKAMQYPSNDSLGQISVPKMLHFAMCQCDWFSWSWESGIFIRVEIKSFNAAAAIQQRTSLQWGMNLTIKKSTSNIQHPSGTSLLVLYLKLPDFFCLSHWTAGVGCCFLVKLHYTCLRIVVLYVCSRNSYTHHDDTCKCLRASKLKIFHIALTLQLQPSHFSFHSSLWVISSWATLHIAAVMIVYMHFIIWNNTKSKTDTGGCSFLLTSTFARAKQK